MRVTRSLNHSAPGRLGVLVAGLLLLHGVLPAQTIGSAEVIVQSVEGVVRYEVSAGRFESVRADQRLSRDTVISTGLFSSVVLSVGEDTVAIRAMQRGTVADLIAARTAARSRVHLGVNVAEREEGTARARPDGPAAPARAADVAADILWVDDIDG